MAYSELIKNFDRIRDYMRQFYVYGFKSRNEYSAKSARSYDNERRRIESWLGGYMSFRQDKNGKRMFISVDSRAVPTNPLYKAFKAGSFTDGDIVFHFLILDMLHDNRELSIKEIIGEMSEKYLSRAEPRDVPDESAVRKKLREYEALGLLTSRKRGRELAYKRSESRADLDSWKEAVAFYSEEDPVGVIGSFILDKYDRIPAAFGFKNHYMLHALDSEVLCGILLAMSERRCVELTIRSERSGNEEKKHTVFPARIFVGTQSGRRYLLGYQYRLRKPMLFRLDCIRKVSAGAVEGQADRYVRWCEKFRENLWGVSAGAEYNIDRVEMTVHIAEGEEHILSRLERGKRCGRVERLEGNTFRFTAEVYDAAELLPWLRTFIGRIEKLECSDPRVRETFFSDLEEMNAMYGGEAGAV